jgi:hypothetical protein
MVSWRCSWLSPLTRDGLARFGQVAARHIGDDRVPGLVALGALSVGGALVQRDSLFRISSTTKPITGPPRVA